MNPWKCGVPIQLFYTIFPSTVRREVPKFGISEDFFHQTFLQLFSSKAFTQCQVQSE